MPDEQRNPIQEYQVAHIPGALFFDVDGISDRTSNLPHMLPSEDAFAAAASALGIDNKDGLVVYDGKGIFSAARVWWMFRVFGHDRVWVLDGGLPRWRASGYDVESSASGDAILKASAASEAIEKVYQGQVVGPITFQTKFQPHLVWTLDQVKKNIEDRTHQQIDARSKARFDGTAAEPRKGIKSGHVPGSKCIPFPQVLDASQSLLPADELKKRFEEEGISLEKPVVTSCGTGVTACVLALFYRPVQDREVEPLAMFLDMLYSMDVQGYGANKVCWKLAMRKRFWGSRLLSLSISSFCHLISLEKVWQSKVSPRVAFFPWTAALGKILTTDNFQNRHIVVLDWCKRCGESAEHLVR
uniref:Rhodanese domain-containing protein n=1 Tax=Quercus lobata TaxID=97700 RepID=A0A7N2R3W9_QUELO